MALSQCSSELSTSPFSSSQPPVCVTQPMQLCRLVLNPFLPGVTEVTLAVLCSAVHATSWRKTRPCSTSPNIPWLRLSHYSSEHTGPLLILLHYYLTQMEADTHTYTQQRKDTFASKLVNLLRAIFFFFQCAG